MTLEYITHNRFDSYEREHNGVVVCSPFRFLIVALHLTESVSSRPLRSVTHSVYGAHGVHGVHGARSSRSRT